MRTQITIRDVDKETFREFKGEAIRHGMSVGTAVTLAMQQFKDELGHKRRKLTSLKPISGGKGTEHTSDKVDEILYGEE